jgi:hypothetical protein
MLGFLRKERSGGFMEPCKGFLNLCENSVVSVCSVVKE